MLFAELLDVLERHAVLIGIGLAIILVLVIPPLRRGVIEAFREGKAAGERLRKKKRPEKDDAEGPAEK